MTGPGDINICGSLTWQAGTMSGTGTTAICPGGSGTLNAPTGTLTLANRTLNNAGDLTWSSGAINQSTGAALVNRGTLHANSEGTVYSCTPGSGTTGGSLIINSSAIDKDQGAGTTDIDCPMINTGRVGPPSLGQLKLPNILNSDEGVADLGDGQAEGVDCSPPRVPAADAEAWALEVLRDPNDVQAENDAFQSSLETFTSPADGGPGDETTLVIGENQQRVDDYARANGLSVYAAPPLGFTKESFRHMARSSTGR